MTEPTEFKWKIDEFADIQILRYKVHGYNTLSNTKKELLYYLYRAALAGRDIMWDQNYRYNLYIRHVLETIYMKRPDNWETSDNWVGFIVYLKRVWLSNGIHHHYSNAKFAPDFSQEWFTEQVSNADIRDPPPACDLVSIVFDSTVASVKVQQDTSVDRVVGSAVNFYQNVTEDEVVQFYIEHGDDSDEPSPVGLNSKLVGGPHGVVEMIWSVNGMYASAIKEICVWLEKAIDVTESPQQATSLTKLIDFFKTGNPSLFDMYSLEWIKDTEYDIDVICGFIEDYNDPLNRKCSFETVVTVRDPEASKRMEALCKDAQWFEDNSPTLPEHKKKEATGVNARVVNVVMESGDASPSTPIGICLPNSDWIRKEHGSKSINIDNIINAYDAASASGGGLQEFCSSPEELDRAKKHLEWISKISVDLHEVLGHGSGKMMQGVDPTTSLKGYSAVIEEARADLFALWYIVDPKLVEMGIVESYDAAKSEYDSYILNGIMCQLRRIKLGDDIQQTHMRQRQMIAKWLYVNAAGSIEKIERDKKTFFRIIDYEKMRAGVGELLCEVQRIKSTGDYETAEKLVQDYGVKIDPILHAQVLDRYRRLGTKPYSGFVNPRLSLTGIEFPDDFAEQMLEYSRESSTLPDYNTRPLTIYVDLEIFIDSFAMRQMVAAGHTVITADNDTVFDQPGYLVSHRKFNTPETITLVPFGEGPDTLLRDWSEWYKILY